MLDSRDELVRLVTFRHRETLRNRRIELLLPWADRSGDQQPRRQGGRSDRDDGEDRTAGMWRDGRTPQRDRDENPDRRRAGYTGTASGDDRDRDFERGWRNPDWQDLPRKESGERSGGTSDSDRDRRQGRSPKFTKFQNADSSRSSDVEHMSDWRANMKGPLDEPRGRDERERTRDRDRGEWRADRRDAAAADERKDRGDRDRESSPPTPGAWRKGPPLDRSEPVAPSQPAERKKLQLAPRSVNATAAQAAELSERSAALFGGAKPVDTRTKEVEIEHRIEQKTRRDSAGSTGKEQAPAKSRGDEERNSRSTTPQQRSRTPSPSAPRRAPRRASRSSRERSPSPSPAEQSHERQERQRTPSPARSSAKSPTASYGGDRAPFSSPSASDRSAQAGAERVRRDKETGEPGLEDRDRGSRRRLSQAEDEERQRPASRSDRSPESRRSERPSREEDSERRYPERRRYEGESFIGLWGDLVIDDLKMCFQLAQS